MKSRRRLTFVLLLLIGIAGPLQAIARACCASPAAAKRCCCPAPGTNGDANADPNDRIARACCRATTTAAVAPTPAPAPPVEPESLVGLPAVVMVADFSSLLVAAATVHLPARVARPPSAPLWLSLRSLRC